MSEPSFVGSQGAVVTLPAASLTNSDSYDDGLPERSTGRPIITTTPSDKSTRRRSAPPLSPVPAPTPTPTTLPVVAQFEFAPLSQIP